MNQPPLAIVVSFIIVVCVGLILKMMKNKNV